jgi:hypothetical protein
MASTAAAALKPAAAPTPAASAPQPPPPWMDTSPDTPPFQVGQSAEEQEALKRADAARKQGEKDIGALRETAQRSQAAIQADRASLPQVPDLKPAPAPVQTTPAQAWGSAAMFMAVVGGMMSSNHASAAMNAGAAVLDAFHKGDVEESQRQFDVWKANNENLGKVFQWQMDRLSKDVELAQKDFDFGKAQFDADAAAMGINTDYIKTAEDMQKHIADMAAAYQTYQTNSISLKVDERNARALLAAMSSPDWPKDPVKSLQLMRMFDSGGGAGGLTGGQAAAEAAVSDDTLRHLADRFLDGDPSVQAEMSAMGPINRNRYLEIQKDEQLRRHMSDQQVAALGFSVIKGKAEMRALGLRAGTAEMSVAEAEGIGRRAKQLSDQIPRAHFIPYEKARQLWKGGFNDKPLAAFVVATQSFINTYAKGINPQGQMHEMALREAERMLNQAMDQGAYDAAVDSMMAELYIAKQAPEIVMERFKREYGLTDEQVQGTGSADMSVDPTGFYKTPPPAGGAAPPGGGKAPPSGQTGGTPQDDKFKGWTMN